MIRSRVKILINILVNESEMYKPKEAYMIENSSIKCYREYKTKNLLNKKNYVTIISFHGVNFSFACKNEKSMTKIFELVTNLKLGESINKDSNSKKQVTISQRFNMTNVNFSSGGKKNEKVDNKIKNRHYKHKSCGDQELLSYVDESVSGGKNKSTSVYYQTESEKTIQLSKKNNMSNKNINIQFPQNQNNQNNQKLNDARQNFLHSRNSSLINQCKLSRNKHEENFQISNTLQQMTTIKNSLQLVQSTQKEENSSLQKMISNMMSTKKIKGKATDSFIQCYNGDEVEFLNVSNLESNINNLNNNSKNNKNSSVINSRKKQIGKIIKLSFPNTENASKSPIYKPPKLNFDQSLIKAKENENPQSTFMFNMSQEEMSFEEKDKVTNSESERIILMCQKLENFEEYYFDSSIFKRSLKSFNLSKKDIGIIYTQIEKEYIKSQMLTEMIATISKRFLNESVLKSLEIVFREKDLNKNFFIGPNHQHSIEFCIVDIFNTFLGNNRESDEFFTKVLPGYLSDSFRINIILNIKNLISIPNLFVLMQNHNKIFFNDNIDINFNDRTPFVVQDIKYISPHNVNKWYYKAMENTTGMYSKENQLEGENKNNFMTTNVKRMKHKNFEMMESFEKMLSLLKKSEKDQEDLRINLIKNIYFHIFNKRNELALKLCDFYVQKFTDSIFLNPIIYLVLSEIYNESSGLELARLFYEKAVNILNWQFPNQTNPLMIDLNYTFSLILMKQSVNLMNNTLDDENLDNSSIEAEKYYKEIEELLIQSKELCDKFFYSENERKVKIVLQNSLIKFSHSEFNLQYNDSFSHDNIISEILKSLDFLNSSERFKEELIYLNLFIDVMKNMINVDDEIKIKFIQRLHDVKKLIESKK